MTRGRLARETGVNIETVRYYEKVGLLPEPPRSAGGHRIYGDVHLRRLIFIRRARHLGFAVTDIRTLLGLVDGKSVICADIKAIADAHLDAIAKKIADLSKLQAVLSDIASQCGGDDAPACPIIDALLAEDAR